MARCWVETSGSPACGGILIPRHRSSHFGGDGIVSKVLVRDGDFVAQRAALVEMFDPGSLVIRFSGIVLTGNTEAVATRYRDGDEFYNVRVKIPEDRIRSGEDIAGLILNCAQGGYLRLRDVAEVRQAVGPVEIAREDQVKEVIVRGDAMTGVSVGEDLSALEEAMTTIKVQVGYEISYGSQPQMIVEMKHSVLLILVFALFFAFVVLGPCSSIA